MYSFTNSKIKPGIRGSFKHDRAKKESHGKPNSRIHSRRTDSRRINYSFHGETVYLATLNNPGVKNLCILELNLLLVVGRRAFEFSGSWILPRSWRRAAFLDPPRGRENCRTRLLPSAKVRTTARRGAVESFRTVRKKDHRWRRAFGFGCRSKKTAGREAERKREGRGTCAMRRYTARGRRGSAAKTKGETRIRRACRERGKALVDTRSRLWLERHRRATRPRTRPLARTVADLCSRYVRFRCRDYFVDRASARSLSNLSAEGHGLLASSLIGCG